MRSPLGSRDRVASDGANVNPTGDQLSGVVRAELVDRRLKPDAAPPPAEPVLILRSVALAADRTGQTPLKLGGGQASFRTWWLLVTVRKRLDGPREIADIGFAPAVGTPTGVEIMSLAELTERPPSGWERQGCRHRSGRRSTT
jgi:hypothetical protein